MSGSDLGKLVPIELRDVWPGESSHLTPWLAREENPLTQGEMLGLEPELEAQEKAVGAFRADLLCKDAGTGPRSTG